jgi:hypothetical protein
VVETQKEHERSLIHLLFAYQPMSCACSCCVLLSGAEVVGPNQDVKQEEPWVFYSTSSKLCDPQHVVMTQQLGLE